MSEDQRQWSWWAAEGDDPETYHLNAPSRAALIEQARREWLDGATITVIEATQDGPYDTAVFDEDFAEVVLDKFHELNASRFGEDGCEGLDLEEIAAALQRAFDDYMAKAADDILPWGFTGTRNRETIVLAPPS